MKQFISVEDVPDIQHLVNKALAYKINPYLHSTLGNKKSNESMEIPHSILNLFKD